MRASGPGLRLGRITVLAVLPLALVALWQLADWLFDPAEFLLPSPATIARTLVDERSRLWDNAQVTALAALLGLVLAALAGCLLALAISVSRAFEAAVYPWVIASQTVPILAVAPLFVVWFDYGVAQVLLVALVCFFPVVVCAVDGLRAADPLAARTLRTMGAGRGTVWRTATLPAALPSLFSGLRLAAVFSVTGAVVAEYVGADAGLGYLSRFSGGQFETDLVFACIAWLTVTGLVFFAAVVLAERLALPHLRLPARPRHVLGRLLTRPLWR
jgi:ABC-type nitrate/sulfonate/bicarbonate transport system permease component